MRHYFDDEEKEIIPEENQPQEEVVDATPSEKKDDGYVMKLPEEEKPEKTIEPNRPAHLSMRIAGAIIDICILFLALMGFQYIFKLTPMGTALNDNNYAALRISDDYKLQQLVEGSEETFGYKLYEGEENYNNYVKNGYIVCRSS